MRHMTVLDALYEAYNRHDTDAAAALYAPDGEHEDVAYGRPKRGREAIADGLRHFLAAFPDAQWKTRDRIVDGDRAVGRYVLTATMQGQLGPFKGEGQRIELRGVHFLELRAEQIVRSEDFWDGATFERQLKHTNKTDPTGTAEERTA